MDLEPSHVRAVPVDGFRPRAADLRKLIADYFPTDRHASILDLGCGHGTLIYFLREAGYVNCEGVDQSHERVALATQLEISRIRCGDAIAFVRSAATESQDCLVTFDFLEHIAKGSLPAFVDDMHRVLKTGGRWIIHAPNGESPFFGRIRYGDMTHELAFTRQSLTELLASGGFINVECHEDIMAVTNVKRLARRVVWKTIRSILRLWLAAETGDTGRTAILTQNLLAIATK